MIEAINAVPAALPLNDSDSVRASVDQFLRGLPASPAILALGEPTHGVEAFLQLRNDLFRCLVDHHGYLAIALEASCLAATVVDAYVGGADVSIDDALANGFSHGFGAFDGNRSLLEWLRHHNETAETRVRVYGFDAPVEMTHAPSPRIALMPLYEYLAAHGRLPGSFPTRDDVAELLGDDTAWANPNAQIDPAASIGRGAEARVLRIVADDLADAMQRGTAHLIARSGIAGFRQAQLHARTAVGLLRYHAALAADDPDRAARAMGIRAVMMADNLLAILQEEEGRGPVLAFAHNGHLQRSQGSFTLGEAPMEFWGAGSIVSSTIGSRYAYIATDHSEPGNEVTGTLQHLLRQFTEDRGLFLSSRFAAETKYLEPLPAKFRRYLYLPIDPGHLDEIDGVAFVTGESSADA